MTKDAFQKGIAVLIATFPEKEIIAEITYQCLKDLSDEQFLRAIVLILKTEKQINKATNIIALIREKALVRDQKLPGEAWLEVRKKIMGVGSYGTPTFKESLIQKAVEIMGWRNLCLSENQMADRAHFLKIYDTLINREEKNILEGKKVLINFDGQAKISMLTQKIGGKNV